jgi:hypothetical protein
MNVIGRPVAPAVQVANRVKWLELLMTTLAIFLTPIRRRPPWPSAGNRINDGRGRQQRHRTDERVGVLRGK